MSDRSEYYKAYAIRRRELDKERRSTTEGKERQAFIRRERHQALKRCTLKTEWDTFVRKEADLLCKQRFAETGIEWDPDHMIPLRAKTVSGLNCGDNIQVIPAQLNRSKKNRLILTERNEWLKYV